MNKRKWTKLSEGGPCASTLLAKLMEEVGEVANALIEKSAEDITEELEHVVFIARELEINIVKFGVQRNDA